MMMSFKNAFIAMAAVGCMLAATDGQAQTLTPPGQRPMPGLFGRARSGDGLDMAVRTFEAYDDDQGERGSSSVLDPRVQKSGMFDGLDVAIVGKRHSRRISFEASGQSAVRYYPSLEDLVGVRHEAAGRITGQFQHTQFSASQTAAYAPYYSYWTLPALVEAQPAEAFVPTAHLLSRRPAVITQSSGTFSQTLGRTTFSAAASTQLTSFREESQSQLRSDIASAGLVYHLNRDLGVVARYELQRGRYELPELPLQIAEYHNIELGLNYDHALSLTRRTIVGFATGTTVLRDASGAPAYHLIGDARLSREIGRSWLATAAYHRGAGLIAGFGQPFFADAVQFGVTGLLTQRLALWTSAGLSKGDLTAVRGDNATDTYSASARLQYALSRMLAVTGEYDYFNYHFASTDGLPIGLPPTLGRNSVRLGLTVLLPLYQ